VALLTGRRLKVVVATVAGPQRYHIRGWTNESTHASHESYLPLGGLTRAMGWWCADPQESGLSYSHPVNDHGQERYLAEVAERERLDREIRFLVLDTAVTVEHELMSVAVFYLGGGSEQKQELVERLIGDWGGMKAATKIVRTALVLHGRADSKTTGWFHQVRALMDLRHRLAHGTTKSWQANPPEVRDGRLGREVRTRTRSGQLVLQWIDFEEAEEAIIAGRMAATSLSRTLADIARTMRH
jgi:hypothetical protein